MTAIGKKPVDAARIAARARELAPTTPPEKLAAVVAADLQIDVETVKRALLRFAGETPDHVPATQKGAGGAGVAALFSRERAMGSTKRWDPIGRLAPEMQARLSEGDRALIQAAVDELQKATRKAKLDYVPVFGYLSLRTHNFKELGKKSQDDVVIGRDVVGARLPGFDVDVVASTMYRGTPEHPGVVAGLSPQAGKSAPGVVLKVPLDRAEELLAVLLAREFFAEGDLNDSVGADGKQKSNAMYAPAVHTVELDEGEPVAALVFMTNPDGAKALPELSTEQLAYFMAGQGGFVDKDGKTFGGPSVDYWEKSYVQARKLAGQPVNEKIAAAVELSKLLPQQEVVDRIVAGTTPDDKLMTRALQVLFAGATVPVELKRLQKDQGDALTRTPQGTRGTDAERLLLEKARALERDGKL